MSATKKTPIYDFIGMIYLFANIEGIRNTLEKFQAENGQKFKNTQAEFKKAVSYIKKNVSNRFPLRFRITFRCFGNLENVDFIRREFRWKAALTILQQKDSTPTGTSEGKRVGSYLLQTEHYFKERRQQKF